MALKTKNSCILTALNQNVLRSIKKSFDDVLLDAKIYRILPASPQNSTTVIMLVVALFYTQFFYVILSPLSNPISVLRYSVLVTFLTDIAVLLKKIYDLTLKVRMLRSKHLKVLSVLLLRQKTLSTHYKRVFEYFIHLTTSP